MKRKKKSTRQKKESIPLGNYELSFEINEGLASSDQAKVLSRDYLQPLLNRIRDNPEQQERVELAAFFTEALLKQTKLTPANVVAILEEIKFSVHMDVMRATASAKIQKQMKGLEDTLGAIFKEN
jgi:hypothetical protein